MVKQNITQTNKCSGGGGQITNSISNALSNVINILYYLLRFNLVKDDLLQSKCFGFFALLNLTMEN